MATNKLANSCRADKDRVGFNDKVGGLDIAEQASGAVEAHSAHCMKVSDQLAGNLRGFHFERLGPTELVAGTTHRDLLPELLRAVQ